MKCVFCDSEMVFEILQYRNIWGVKTRFESVQVHVCKFCDRIVFEPEEAKRLQVLAQTY